MEDQFNFLAGEVLLVNKPLHWTSFDVVNKLRYEMKQILGIKKIKVGHAGTLDPLADGLLIICTGKKTKTIDSYMDLEKTYSGSFKLGATTPSYDLETEIDETFPIDTISEESIISLSKQMVGDYEQYPPIFSAKKVNGKKAYDLARAGEEVKLKAKLINISKFEITSLSIPVVDFEISCSKGTYIRSIAHDFGRSLKNGAHLTALRREAIGEYKLSNSKTVEEWIQIIRNIDRDNITPISS